MQFCWISGLFGYSLGMTTVVMVALHHPVNKGKYTCPFVVGRDFGKKLLTSKFPSSNKD